MADMNKVLVGLKAHSINRHQYCCNQCPYENSEEEDEDGNWEGECTECLARDALELLEDKEPVKPYFFINGNFPAGAFRCSVCQVRILEKDIDFYCSYCGRAVNWNDYL